MARPFTSLPERILKNVVLDENECWLWQLAKDAQGYGRIQFDLPERKSALVHRVAYEQFIGPIQRGYRLIIYAA